jgi:Domain of unknown function (DUF4397)
MLKKSSFYSLIILASMLTACGGGGGGGGSSAGGEVGTGIRVLHAAIDVVPVDVISTAAQGVIVSQAVFAASSSYRSLPSGTQVLSLTTAFNSTQVIATFNLDVSSDSRQSIVLYGDNQSRGTETKLLNDQLPESFTGGLIRVVNGATGASALSVSTPTDSLTVDFGASSQYVKVTPGVVQVVSRVALDGAIVTTNALTVEEGRAYTVLIAGEVGYYAKGVVFSDN